MKIFDIVTYSEMNTLARELALKDLPTLSEVKQRRAHSVFGWVTRQNVTICWSRGMVFLFLSATLFLAKAFMLYSISLRVAVARYRIICLVLLLISTTNLPGNSFYVISNITKHVPGNGSSSVQDFSFSSSP